MEEQKMNNIHPLAAKIFDADDTRKEPIDLSDYGIEEGSLFAYTIPSLMSQKISKMCSFLKPGIKIENSKPQDWEMSDDYIYLMIVASVKDPEGNKVFEKDHIQQLQEKSEALVARIYDAVNKANSMTEKEIEEEEKK